MDLKEVNDLSLEEEKNHWWINTRFNYIDRALRLLKKDQLKVAEYGCGTGQNLWYLREKSSLGNCVQSTTGVDLNLDDSFHPSWMRKDDHFTSDIHANLKGSDLILGMDVLEHIDDDLEALKAWSENLDSQGVILITVPAFQSLWSYHDVFLEHKRRYTKKELKDLAAKAGLEPVFLSYAFSYLFPVVYMIRRLLGSGIKKEASSDLKPPIAPINFALKIIGKVEAFLGGFPFFGTSVVGIFKRQ
jgi:SAM-dependent methyltransferase